jgi:hypothetical protein
MGSKGRVAWVEGRVVIVRSVVKIDKKINPPARKLTFPLCQRGILFFIVRSVVTTDRSRIFKINPPARKLAFPLSKGD